MSLYDDYKTAAAPAAVTPVTPPAPASGGSSLYGQYQAASAPAPVAPVPSVAAPAPANNVIPPGQPISVKSFLGTIPKAPVYPPGTPADVIARGEKIGQATPSQEAAMPKMSIGDTIRGAQTAQEALGKGPGQYIKLPFMDTGLYVPQGAPESILKGVVETPERITKSVAQVPKIITSGGQLPPDPSKDTSPYHVDTYFQYQGQLYDQLKKEGYSDAMATAGSLLGAGGSAILDIAGAGQLLQQGLSAIAAHETVPTDAHVMAWKLLGSPETLDQAEQTYRAMQHQVHPDIAERMGLSAEKAQALSSQANNAIAILREEGIPAEQSLVGRAAKAATSPISDIADNLKGTGEAATEAVPKPEVKALPEAGAQAPVAPELNPEAGFVKPGEIVSDIKAKAGEVQQFIQETQKGLTASKNVADDLYTIDKNAQADKVAAVKFLEQSKMSPTDAEAIYHYAENKNSPITAYQKQLYEKEVVPLTQEITRIVTKLRPTVPLNSENYTPRYVAGKGSVMDRIENAIEQGKTTVRSMGAKVGLGSPLNKSAPALKRRVMRAVVDEKGARTVVAVKKGRVTAFRNGIKQDLGLLTLKSNAQLQEREIKPIQARLDKLQQQLKALARVNIKTPYTPGTVTRIEGELRAIASDIFNVSDTHAIDQAPRFLDRERELMKKLKIIEQAKTPEELSNRSKVIASVQRDMVKLVNEVADIEHKYNPAELNNKVFTGSNGKRYRIVNATTKEIEQHSGLTYHKNVLANNVITYLKLRQVERASDFLESWKTSPGFSDIAQEFGKGETPEGWRPVNLPQFRGYSFEPHVAAELDRFGTQLIKHADPLQILSSINRFLRTSIFFNPLIHVPNIGVHWLVNRGLTPFARPSGYADLYKTSTRAINAVMHQNEDYMMMLRQGAPLMDAGRTEGQLMEVLTKKMASEISTNPQLEAISKIFGYVNPVNWVRAVYGLAGRVTWAINDIATLQSIYENMEHGMSIEQSITETGRHIPNYRIPGTILNSEAVQKLLTNPNVTMFGAYHYGALRSYAEMVKDAIGGSGKAKAEVLDKLAMMGLLAFVIYPALDMIAQKVTGNKLASFRRAGALTLPSNLYKFSQGTMTFSQLMQSIITPAPATKEALQVFFNRDFFTGNEILPPDSGAHPLDTLGTLGKHFVQQISPVQQATKLTSGTSSFGDFVSSLFGISSPKTSGAGQSALSLLYGQRPQIQKQVKQLWSQGKQAEAQKLINDYNDRFTKQAMQAAQDMGVAAPNDTQLKKSLLAPPTAKTLKNYDSQQGLTAMDKVLGLKNNQTSTTVSMPSLLDEVGLYAHAFGTDFPTAFHLLFAGQTLKKVGNGTIQVLRDNAKEAQVKRELAGATPLNTLQLDHIIPLEIGGSNEKSNMRIVPKARDVADSRIENGLADRVHSGSISERKAQQLMLDYKNGKISADQALSAQ